MTGFKIKDWMEKRLSQAKAAGSRIPIRFGNLTGAMKAIVSKFPNVSPLKQWIQKHRLLVVGGVAAVGLVLVGTYSVQSYVDAKTFEVYNVYVKGELAGSVSSPKVVDDFKITKFQELQEKNPNVHMVLNSDEIVLKPEKAYNAKSDDTAALQKLNELTSAHAVGVELVVNHVTVGIVKDKDTAEAILAKIKDKYSGLEKKDSKVSILSVAEGEQSNPGETTLEKAGFVEQVDLLQRKIDPDQVMSPDDMLAKLETGDVQPTKYTVQPGDCVSCIAKKFDISRQVIYENNPWIVDDKLKIGQVLDLTVLQPTLSVQTVEKVVEQQEVAYDTDYVLDDDMRAGTISPISPGKNGLKNVIFEVTKVNGIMMDERMVSEEVLVQPIKALAKKGTKVVLGEGSGKFAWPVISASVSSGFGYRWGKLHKGVDLTGNKSILAADNGKVEETGYKSDYGNYIIINHMNGYKTLYGHLSKIGVDEGQIVEKGEKIGVMGSTGDSTGTHLHFEIIKEGNVQNPLKYLNQ